MKCKEILEWKGDKFSCFLLQSGFSNGMGGFGGGPRGGVDVSCPRLHSAELLLKRRF